jgi:glycerophosphoryl diester phosphodiesterase
VPTLDEALVLAAELGLGANIELKSDRGREYATAAAVAAIIRRLGGRAPAVLVSSFLVPALVALREVASAIPRSVLFRVVPRGWAEMAYRLGCTTIGADHRRLQPRRIAAVRAAGYRLATYTVNDPFRANLLFEWGVSSVFSDAPDIIRPHVNRSDVIRSVSAGHHPDLARQGANR